MRLDLKKFFFGDDVMQNIDYSFNMSETEWDGFKPFVSDVLVKGKIWSFAGSAMLECTLDYDFSMPCSRCAEETLKHFTLKVNHNLVREVSDEDNDSYIVVENESIDLDELFYSDIVLEIPISYICKEDCKGLCPQCGKNLNKGSCNCKTNQIDPRLEVLKKLIDN